MRTREFVRRGEVWRFEAGGECALPWPAMLRPPVASAKRMERKANIQRQVEGHKHLGHCEYRRTLGARRILGWVGGVPTAISLLAPLQVSIGRYREDFVSQDTW